MSVAGVAPFLLLRPAHAGRRCVVGRFFRSTYRKYAYAKKTPSSLRRLGLFSASLRKNGTTPASDHDDPTGGRIAIGADHAGCDLKDSLASYLGERGYQVVDVGTRDSGQSVDYPVYALAVAGSVAAGDADLGILVCGTGIGMSIAANKVRGIRAACAHDVTTARLAREHNDANVLTIGARLIAAPLAIEIVDAWLRASFSPRHARRLDLIAKMERDKR